MGDEHTEEEVTVCKDQSDRGFDLEAFCQTASTCLKAPALSSYVPLLPPFFLLQLTLRAKALMIAPSESPDEGLSSSRMPRNWLLLDCNSLELYWGHNGARHKCWSPLPCDYNHRITCRWRSSKVKQ